MKQLETEQRALLTQFQGAALLVFLSLFFWMSGVVGSSALIGPGPAPTHEATRGTTSTSAESMAVPELISQAQRLLIDGATQGDQMQALELLRIAVTKEPSNRAALREIASLSFEHQVFDKAEEYYRRYLELEPSDEKAQTDYALVLVQIGRAAEGEASLRKILQANERSFPARLSLALALNAQGKKEAARAEAVRAKDIAPDAKAIEIVDGFLKRLDEPNEEKPAEDKAVLPPLEGSPASAVTHYFQNHPIVGPKIVRMKWNSATALEIQLDSFPMDKMPEAVRERFLNSVRQLLSAQKEKISVILVDAASKAELAKIEG